MNELNERIISFRELIDRIKRVDMHEIINELIIINIDLIKIPKMRLKNR